MFLCLVLAFCHSSPITHHLPFLPAGQSSCFSGPGSGIIGPEEKLLSHEENDMMDLETAVELHNSLKKRIPTIRGYL